jgi:hypothetical protein
MSIMIKMCNRKGKGKILFWGRVKYINFTLVQATKAQRGSRCVALLSL